MIRNAQRSFPAARAVTSLLLAANVLAGCESLANGMHAIGLPVENWEDVRKQPQPQAVPQSYFHAVGFPGNEAALSPDARIDLRRFLANLDVSGRDQVLIVSPAAGGPMNEQRVRAVGAVLAAAGLGWSRTVSATTPEDEIGVVVERVVVTLPPCPNWTQMPNWGFSNQPISNWGCSTAVDLGMMVAEPGDLNLGRVPGPSDGTVLSGSIDRYRQGKTTPLIRDSGSSDVYQSATGN